MMELKQFCTQIKQAFEAHSDAWNVSLDEETHFLKVFDSHSGAEGLTVDLKALYKMAGHVPMKEIQTNIIEAYELKQKTYGPAKQITQENLPKNPPGLENILFLADKKDKKNVQSGAYIDKGDMILRFCFEDDESGDFVFLTRKMTQQRGWSTDTLLAHGVQNMRRRYPCHCIPLEEFVKKQPEKILLSVPAVEQIYILACEDSSFEYASTGLYYSAKEIKEFASEIQSELYVFQCDKAVTFLCPADAFTRDEAEEILESFLSERKSTYTKEVMVYADKQLFPLSEYRPDARQIRAKSL